MYLFSKSELVRYRARVKLSTILHISDEDLLSCIIDASVNSLSLEDSECESFDSDAHLQNVNALDSDEI